MTLKINLVLGSGGHSRTILENLYQLKKKNIEVYDLNFLLEKKNYIFNNNINDFKKISKKKSQKKMIFFLQ